MSPFCLCVVVLCWVSPWAPVVNNASVGGSMAPFRAGTPPKLTRTPMIPLVRPISVFLNATSDKLSVDCASVAEPSVLRGALYGHTDAVWGLAYSSAHQRLLSCSADGTLRLWDATNTSPSLTVFNEKGGEGVWPKQRQTFIYIKVTLQRFNQMFS